MNYLAPLKYHYKTKKGWVNDPNGLVYFDGYCHVFYQHAPHYETPWKEPMHWGHARTKDFLNWEELYPGLEIARGDRLYINETPLGKKWRLSYLLDQYYLCVRRLGDDVTASDDEKHREVQRRCLDFVHEIIVEAYPEWADKKPDIP